ncbi:MAG: hypothetical protein WC539_00270 [Nitrospirota bacterium]
MKKFATKLTLFVFPVLLLVVCANYFGDAGNLFSKTAEVRIAEYLTEGYNVANMLNIDERALQRNIIKLTKTAPAIVVLGSSTIMLIRSHYYNTNSFKNNGVSGASLEDIIAIYQMYKLKGSLPKKIVIGIDPWIFNKHSGQSRWKTLKMEYLSFFSSKISLKESTVALDKFMQLFSPSYFQSSIKILLRKIKDKEEPIFFPTTLATHEGSIKFTDGSISYDLNYRNVTIHDVQNRAKQFISHDIYSLERYVVFSKEYVDLLNSFIEEILSHNIQLEFILMPYHPLVYDFLVANTKYKIIEELERYIQEIALNKKILLRGSYNPRNLGLNGSHFYDGMHLNERGVRVIFEAI